MSSDFATAGGHWYRHDGTPAYTIVGKNGKERPTTLRDARQHGLLPSVSGIIRTAAAPALERWKRNQVLLAALTLPRLPDEAEAAWLERVEQDWQAAGRMAAAKGEEIHGAIERHFRGELPAEEWWDWVKAATAVIHDHCGTQEWRAERSFAHPLGYGGKTDLHSQAWVIDYKTKDGDVSAAFLYDDHYMQLAAYRRALAPNARCAILFVSRDEPVARFVEADPDKLASGLKMFDALLSYWQHKAGYYPAMQAAA